MVNFETQRILNQRKEKVIDFVKLKFNWIVYFCLAIIVYLGVWIRTRNLSGLRDITTGGWTLGPDLDPFLFLRYAKYIVENGSLYSLDVMRYVPLGIQTGDFSLHYYSIAWFHKLALIFGSNSVEQSASIFPVFMFSFTIIAFFLLSRKILSEYLGLNFANIGALISSIFLSVFPLFIPRSIAGIPEKESYAFLFMFLAFYFLIESWNNKNLRNRIIFGVLAGLSTAFMALIWGAYSYIFFIVVPASFISFLIGNFEKKQIISYGSWFIVSAIIMVLFSNRYSLMTTLTSFDRGSAFALLLCVCFYHYIYPKFNRKIEDLKSLSKIPSRLMSTIVFGIGMILLIFLTLGPKFIVERLFEVYSNFVRPATSRLIQTVAENRQPYLVEWMGNFGPNIGKFFVSFWLFLIGAIILFWKTFENFSKSERVKLTFFFGLMIFLIIFTRYSSESLFNGQSLLSLILYGGGILVFLISLGIIYFKSSKKSNVEEYNKIKFEFLILMLFLFIALISARGFIRLVMILVPPVSIILGYLGALSIKNIKEDFRIKAKGYNFILNILIILLILFSAYSFLNSSKNLANGYVPSSYNQQWQKAMSWVRENTISSAVFGHWWDYGYWVQSIGERATALDGGNSIPYWNHLMGRHGLTETNFDNSLQFFFAHNITHYLIDSTDIGKYSAFSTIGSDQNYDRRSWIPTLLKDNAQTIERKNTTLYVYSGGSAIDKDLNYKLNGTDIFLPEGKTYLAAVIYSINKENQISELYGVYVLQGKTYQIPLRYYFDSNTGLVDRKIGLDAGVLIYPRVVLNSAGGGDVDPRGAILYLSPKVVNSNLARFYLYGQENKYFKLAHQEDDQIVDLLNNQGFEGIDFVFFNEFRGPIKIWEVSYPSDIHFNQSYLETDYPDSIRLA